MLRSEMNACNEWEAAALYLLNSLMPALGQERCQCAQGDAEGEGGFLCGDSHLLLRNSESGIMLPQ